MVADKVSVSPTMRLRDVLFNDTDVTGTDTVTEHFAETPPAVAVTVAEPPAMAFILPFESTVATDVLELFQETVLFDALSGNTVAVKVMELPTLRDTVVLSRRTSLTATVLDFTAI